jgi:serine protease Do
MFLALLVALAAGIGMARAEPYTPAAGSDPPSALSSSSTAERVYAAARPRLLQIRTLVTAAGRQSSLGSGFLVSGDGLALTNYHVVSQYALEPQAYRLEYTTADGRQGALALLAIDLADDLAVVRVDKGGDPFFTFDERALKQDLPKGERLYSMGNPLDLGFTIVEGTYNGLVERSYNERIHFSGAINPGMSGGPTVTAEGKVVGINVSKQFGGELVSFLVPARFAAALIARARDAAPPSPSDLRAEIGRQLDAWQANLYQSIDGLGFRTSGFGPYRAPELAAPWFTCWAQTNVGQVPKPRASAETTICNSDTRLFVANDLSTGLIQVSHAFLRSLDLNAFQFAALLSRQYQPAWIGGWGQKWYTRQRCHEAFVAASPAGEHPPLRAVWCARAYRQFEGLYDVWVMTVTQDRDTEALVSRLTLQGVAYDNAIALTKRFIEAVQWAK